MKRATSNPSFMAKLWPAFKRELDGWAHSRFEFYSKIKGWIRQCSDIVDSNFQLGLYHFYQGRLMDASMRFKGVVFLDPQHAKAHYYLGRCFLYKGDEQSARQCFNRALEADARFTPAHYFLSKLQFPERIKRINTESIIEDMRMQMPHYRQTLLEEGYQGHIIARELIKHHLLQDQAVVDVLDIGCAGGLCVEALKAKGVVTSATGVDIVPEAIEILERELYGDELLYNSLHAQDIEMYFSDHHPRFDVIMAVNVLHYFSSLDAVFKSVSHALKEDGLFVGTVFLSKEQRWELDAPNDRFLHLASYLKHELEHQGFEWLEQRNVPLFVNKSEKNALFFVCRKKRSASQRLLQK